MEDRNGFALRGAKGINLYKGVSNSQQFYSFDVVDPANDIRVMQYSNNGNYLAFCNSLETYLIDTETGEEVIKYPAPKPTMIVFSPKDTYFVSWEMYCVYGRRRGDDGTIKTPKPNINFYSVAEKKHLKTIIGKRREDLPQWTYDEKYMVQIIGSEVLAFEDGNMEKSKFKNVILEVSAISVSPHQSDHFFAAFVPSKNGGTARVELRRINKEMTSSTSVTFMNCDKINMSWNSKGTTLLALASVDVDKSGKSYYGQSFLQVLQSNGEKARVLFDKEGSVHDVKWSPTGSHFAVCYGFMPAKVAVYNHLGNAVWNLGEGHRNEVHFNIQGNLLITCGFGSLTAGKIQIWNFVDQEEVNKIEVENTTHLEFSGDGQHFYTATTAPRMRVDNRYRLWHYTGKLLFEYAPTTKYELWQIMWKPVPEAVNMKFNPVSVTKEDKLQTGLKFKVMNGDGEVEVAAGSVKKAAAYIPPHMRKEGAIDGSLKAAGTVVSSSAVSENEKKIKKIVTQLRDIQKLKIKQQRGDKLEKNQLDKLEREQELLEEKEKLKPSST